MKYSIVMALLVSSAIALALGARAQDAAPKEHSMTGCLAKGTEPGTYMLTDLERDPSRWESFPRQPTLLRTLATKWSSLAQRCPPKTQRRTAKCRRPRTI
jgi:hypothetical protein